MELFSWSKQRLRDLFDLFLPPACPLCATPIPPSPFDCFCSDCQAQMPPIPIAACRRCAHPYPLETADDHLCATCLAEIKPLFEQVIPGGLYAGTLKEAIHQFKYHDKIDLDHPLGRFLLPKLTHIAPICDLILPVPLHTRRLRQRTYNQSLLIARVLARDLQRPLSSTLLIRRRNTLPQQGQNAAKRRRNLRNAFAVTRQLNGERILLVDDVLTTGTTARECALTLKQAGAGEVIVTVLARAPMV